MFDKLKMHNVNERNVRKQQHYSQTAFVGCDGNIIFIDIRKADRRMDTKVKVAENDSGYAETIYLSKDPKVKKEILEGMAIPIEDCVPEDEVAALFCE